MSLRPSSLLGGFGRPAPGWPRHRVRDEPAERQQSGRHGCTPLDGIRRCAAPGCVRLRPGEDVRPDVSSTAARRWRQFPEFLRRTQPSDALIAFLLRCATEEHGSRSWSRSWYWVRLRSPLPEDVGPLEPLLQARDAPRWADDRTSAHRALIRRRRFWAGRPPGVVRPRSRPSSPPLQSEPFPVTMRR